MDKEKWCKNSRESIIKLCQLYSAYVCRDDFKNAFMPAQNTDRERIDASSRLSLSAFIDIDYLGANSEMVSRMYEYSPKLEGANVLKLKLYSFPNEYIFDILEAYDKYLIDLAIKCGDFRPACLDEYLCGEYQNQLLDSALDMLAEQYKVFEQVRYGEGIEAMHNRNAVILHTVERFIDAFEGIGYEMPTSTIDAIAKLIFEDRMIPAIVNWSEGRDVILAVKTNSFTDMVDAFCRDITGGLQH